MTTAVDQPGPAAMLATSEAPKPEIEASPVGKREWTCRFCERRFRRLEHVQRHERTHTKETPFKCSCGRSFSRRDLLRRHEKLAHGDTDRGARRQSVSSSHNVLSSPVLTHHPMEQTLPSAQQPPLQTPGLAPQASYIEPYQHPDMMRAPDPAPVAPLSFGVDGWSPFDMFEGFLDYADPSMFMDPSFMANHFVPGPAPMPPGSAASMQISNVLVPDPMAPPTYSAAGRMTPFGTPQPPMKRSLAEPARWRISATEYKRIVHNIQDFRDVLPKNFNLLTRHTMSRYLEGCMQGFCEHFPFIHFGTFQVAETAPELLLAMAGMGAEFRFERHRSPPLFYAAKAILEERIRRHKVWSNAASSIPPPSAASDMPSPAPIKTPGSQYASDQQYLNENGNEALVRWGQLQTLQAMVIVLAMGAWSSESLLRESMSLQSLAASLIRDSAKLTKPQDTAPTSWSDWTFLESLKRTKLMFYSILQLMSVAYNVPPLIYTSEIECDLPGSTAKWTAKDATSWLAARKDTSIREAPFQDVFAQLFHISTPSIGFISRFASYVLLLGLLQTIVLKRQTLARTQTISPHDIDELSRALRNWQPLFENSPEANLPQLDTLSSNTTALVRLAWIRLHVDLGPCRNLASREPKHIAAAFAHAAPSMRRTPELLHPVLQATHSLSIPIRMGINYVAKTQTSSWSVQNSLSNLECAILVSKWLEMLADTCSRQPLGHSEQMIVQTITSLVRESGMFDDEVFGDDEGSEVGPDVGVDRSVGGQTATGYSSASSFVPDQKQMIRRLAGAVARLWAEIFKGLHVFELVNIIGTSLTLYAESIESVWMAPAGQY